MKSNSKKELILLTIILICHFSLRLINLESTSLWYDEAYSIFHSQFDINHIIQNSLIDQNPPFYNIILHYWMSFTDVTIYSARLLNVILSGFSLLLIYFISEKHLHNGSGIYSVIIYSLWNFLFFYTVEARCYSLLILLILIQFVLFFKYIESEKINILGLITFSIVSTLILLTHYLSVFIFIPELVYIILFYRKKNKVLLKFIASNVIAAILFIPWLVKVIPIIKSTSTGSYWLKSATFNDLINVLNEYYFNFYVICFLILAIIYIIYKKNSNEKFYFLLLVIILPIISSYFISKIVPSFTSRYLQYTLLGSVFVISYFIISIKNYTLRIAIFGIISIFFYSNLDISPDKNQEVKKPTEEIIKNKLPNSLIIIAPRSIGIPFSYYYDKNAFVNKEYYEWLLLSNDVLLIDNPNEFSRINTEMFNYIYFIHSFDNYALNNQLIKSHLDSNYKSVDYLQYKDFNTTIYHNEKYNNNIKTVFENNSSLFEISTIVPTTFYILNNECNIHFDKENGKTSSVLIHTKKYTTIKDLKLSVLFENEISTDSISLKYTSDDQNYLRALLLKNYKKPGLYDIKFDSTILNSNNKIKLFLEKTGENNLDVIDKIIVN